MYVHVQALRRQRNVREFLALLVAGCGSRLGSSLGLVLGIYGTFRGAHHRLFLSVAGNQGNSKQPGDCRKPGTF